MIPRAIYEQALFETVRRGSTVVPEDVKHAFVESIGKETSESAKLGLESTLRSMELSTELGNPTCPDTGWPIFYLKLGNECHLEEGVMGLEGAARRAVAKATEMGFLRSTMKHPLTGFDPGNNIGENIPNFNYKFVPGSDIEVTFVAKGGGSECFGGTRYRVVAFADGVAGIKKFILDSYIEATKAGAICPPSILGVGIGGSANVATNLAKEAACLRPIGTKHPNPVFAKIEQDLGDAINSLGIGAMGSGGLVSVFGVNVEFAYTHIAGVAVAMSTNCMVARRATTRIHRDGTLCEMKTPNWFEGR